MKFTLYKKVYIGELVEQSFRLQYSNKSENGTQLKHFINGSKWDVNGNEAKPLKPVKIGPLMRNIAYTPIITIKTKLPYTKSDGSPGVLHHISETCYGKSFSSTHWSCADGIQTIPFRKVCDDPIVPQCADGSDEATHLCTGGINYHVIVSLVAYFGLGIAFIFAGNTFLNNHFSLKQFILFSNVLYV